MRRRWSAALNALALIRIGQELGSDTPAARAIHDAIELLASLLSAI